MLKEVKNKWKVKYHCEKGKHDWRYCTWGSAFVDNLDGTSSIWEIPTRTCEDCGKHQFRLKFGWEKEKKNLTIDDLQ